MANRHACTWQHRAIRPSFPCFHSRLFSRRWRKNRPHHCPLIYPGPDRETTGISAGRPEKLHQGLPSHRSRSTLSQAPRLCTGTPALIRSTCANLQSYKIENNELSSLWPVPSRVGIGIRYRKPPVRGPTQEAQSLPARGRMKTTRFRNTPVQAPDIPDPEACSRMDAKRVSIHCRRTLQAGDVRTSPVSS